MLKKIKDFLSRIFKTKKYIDAKPAKTEVNNNTVNKNKTKFKNALNVLENDGIKAINLQKEYETGIITEEGLSAEEYNLISNLYDKQIAEQKQLLEKYKNEILACKKNN